MCLPQDRHLCAGTGLPIRPPMSSPKIPLASTELNILRFVYQAAYPANRAAIESSALFRAFAKPALTALVLHVLCTKLRTFARTVNAPGLSVADRSAIESGIIRLRGRLSAAADGDRLTFIRAIIAASARAMSMFQSGAIPDPISRAYRPISAKVGFLCITTSDVVIQKRTSAPYELVATKPPPTGSAY